MAQVSQGSGTHEPDAMDFCHSRLPARVDLFPETLGHLRHAWLNPEATAESFLRRALFRRWRQFAADDFLIVSGDDESIREGRVSPRFADEFGTRSFFVSGG